MFICAAVGYFDPHTATVTWANAGFPPPIVYSPEQACQTYPALAPPLAIIEQSGYTDETVQLGDGAMYFYSDGVTEARADNGEMLEEQGLLGLIRDQARWPVKPRLGKIVTQLRKRKLADDTTLLIVDAGVRPVSSILDLTFYSCPTRLADVRREVAQATEGVGCSGALVQKLQLVIDEAITNVIRHAYHGQNDGQIRLKIGQTDDTLSFHLRDNAPPVDPAGIKPRDLSECRPGGLGINFIDSVMDTWSFRCLRDGSGNVLEMTKTIERDQACMDVNRGSRVSI